MVELLSAIVALCPLMSTSLHSVVNLNLLKTKELTLHPLLYQQIKKGR